MAREGALEMEKKEKKGKVLSRKADRNIGREHAKVCGVQALNYLQQFIP